MRHKVPSFSTGVDQRLVDEKRVMMAHERYTDTTTTQAPSLVHVAPKSHTLGPDRSAATARRIVFGLQKNRF